MKTAILAIALVSSCSLRGKQLVAVGLIAATYPTFEAVDSQILGTMGGDPSNAAAELSDNQVRALLKALGWAVAW